MENLILPYCLKSLSCKDDYLGLIDNLEIYVWSSSLCALFAACLKASQSSRFISECILLIELDSPQQVTHLRVLDILMLLG